MNKKKEETQKFISSIKSKKSKKSRPEATRNTHEKHGARARPREGTAATARRPRAHGLEALAVAHEVRHIPQGGHGLGLAPQRHEAVAERQRKQVVEKGGCELLADSVHDEFD